MGALSHFFVVGTGNAGLIHFSPWAQHELYQQVIFSNIAIAVPNLVPPEISLILRRKFV